MDENGAQVAAWTPCTHTFDVGDVNVELRQLFTCPLHALVHRLQDFFGILLHPAYREKNPFLKQINMCGVTWRIFSSFITHPSFGKLCLISTWWWLRSSAVFELNTLKETKRHSAFTDRILGKLPRPAFFPCFSTTTWKAFPRHHLHFPSSCGL